jgi:hypothetical protein
VPWLSRTSASRSSPTICSVVYRFRAIPASSIEVGNSRIRSLSLVSVQGSRPDRRGELNMLLILASYKVLTS